MRRESKKESVNVPKQLCRRMVQLLTKLDGRLEEFIK